MPVELCREAEVLAELRDSLLWEKDRRKLYSYQRAPSDAILDSICRCDGKHIPIEFSRQSGKTELVADTVMPLALAYRDLFNKAIRIGTFAPDWKTTAILFDRMKERMDTLFLAEKGYAVEISNANTFVISLGGVKYARIQCLTASKDTTIKGPTFDLILPDECQDINDRVITESIIPMGAATNATYVYTGTPTLGSPNRYFLDWVNRGKAFIVPWQQAAAQNANYAKHVQVVLSNPLTDENSDSFRSQYCLEWLLEFGSPFIDIETRGKPYERLKDGQDRKVIVGIDWAQSPDSTVGTAIEVDGDTCRILDWIELHGDDYPTQVAAISAWAQPFAPQRFICDAVGEGSGPTDYLRNAVRGNVTRFKWTAESHHQVMLNFLTLYGAKPSKIEFPAGPETKRSREYKNFIDQFRRVQKKYAGNLLKVHHPDEADAHDDYVSSFTLACWGARTTEKFGLLEGVDSVQGRNNKSVLDWEPRF